MIDIKAAALELSKKNINTIQRESAYVWASRAIIAFQNFMKTKNMNWYNDGITYSAEAYEHAALVDGGLLKELQSKIGPLEDDAILYLKKKLFANT